ncbi:hypothetical protein BDC45DRAFT_577066 [Circinella umbellata]|nr:hypothetical protein BDC45DRAFT_577066 [Circinella umbellata]
MSTRPEKFIHQKESTEHRHKRDYTTDLYDEWFANQGDEDIMDLDDNVETGSIMLESVLNPEPEELIDFDDYDFGDQQPPVVVADPTNTWEDARETADNDNSMDEEPVPAFDKLYMFIGLFIILFQRQYLSEVAAEKY